MLNTPDKKLVIIPNGPLSTDALTNFFLLKPLVDWHLEQPMVMMLRTLNDSTLKTANFKDPAPLWVLLNLLIVLLISLLEVDVQHLKLFYMNEKVYTKWFYNSTSPSRKWMFVQSE
jgi:small conductance mechanosensitive channel